MVFGSRIGALLVGCAVFAAASGLGLWWLGDASSDFLRYALAARHVDVGGILAALFVWAVSGHVRTYYGPWRAIAFPVVYVLSVAAALAVELPTIEVFLAMPVAVATFLMLGLGRSSDVAVRAAARSGIASAALCWWFFFVTGWLHFSGHQFYLGFGAAHAGLAAVALASVVAHVLHARTSSARARGSIAAEMPARRRRWRLALAAGVVTTAFASTLYLAGTTQRHFVPDPALEGLPFPIRYDTSQARAGRPLTPDPGLTFIPSATCSAPTCHDDIHRQWSISSHRYAAVVTPYRKMIELVFDELGPEATMFCTKCHAPQLALLGLADDPRDRSLDRHREAGISCQYCHSIVAPGPIQGNGEFLLEVRRDHLQGYRRTDPAADEVYRDYVRHSLSVHRQTFRHRDPDADEYCVGCHRAIVPAELAGSRKLVLGDVHTPFLASTARKEGVSCSECHMNLATYWGQTEAHARPDHRLLGTNNAMTLMVEAPFFIEPNLAEFDRITEQFLAGSYSIPPYEQTYLRLIGHPKYLAYVKYLEGNNKIDVSVDATGPAIPGTTARVNVSVRNRTGAHVVPSGPIDLNEYWLEVIARDADGRQVFASGTLDADQRLTPGTVTFGGTPLDCYGKPVEHHRFWTTCSVKDRRVIPVDGVEHQAYEVPIPADAVMPITVTAAFCYRRYGKDMATWLYGGRDVAFPIYRYHGASSTIQLSRPAEPR